MNKSKELDFLNRIKYVQYFFAVRRNIIAANYEEAMNVADRMFALYNERKPSENVKIQLNLIFGMVAANLGRHDDVYMACRIALDQIDEKLQNLKSRKDINKLRYFRGYCKELVGFADAEGGKRDSFDFHDIDKLVKPDFEIGLISDFLRRTFPIHDTSWWSGGE